MSYETADYINQLNQNLPQATDTISEGDIHLRLLKEVLKQSFPNVNMPVNAIHTSDSEPSLFSAGTVWFDTSTGLIKMRDMTNTKWMVMAHGQSDGIGNVIRVTPHYWENSASYRKSDWTKIAEIQITPVSASSTFLLDLSGECQVWGYDQEERNFMKLRDDTAGEDVSKEYQIIGFNHQGDTGNFEIEGMFNLKGVKANHGGDPWMLGIWGSHRAGGGGSGASNVACLAYEYEELALTPLENVGQGGIVTDVAPYQLQPNQWSGGNNVAFRDGSIKKINGFKEVLKDCPIEPWHLGTYQQHNHAGRLERDGFYWIVFGMREIWVNHNEEWYNITRQDEDGNIVTYGTLNGSDWDVTQSGALLIATNGVDVPQLWKLDENNKVSVDQPMVNMESWVDKNTPDGTYMNCQTVEGFKNHIITTAIDVQYTDQPIIEQQNRTVKWSTQHGHYAEPATWDVTDDKHDAGEYELLDTQGPIIDTLPMGELFIIYKADSVYMMSYVGTPYIFSFKTLDPQVGIIAKGAAVEYPGGHFFVSHSDCYINNGQTIMPILSGKVRGEMFNNINGNFYDRIFCVANLAANEIWACFPTVSSDYCDKAMVWNYKDNTFSFRDLPRVTDIKSGVQKVGDIVYSKDDPSTITWESSDPDPSVPLVPWRSVTTMRWGAISYANIVANLVMAAPPIDRGDPANPDLTGKLYRDGIGQKEDGKLMYSYAERTGIDFGDPSSVKHLRAIWPKITVKGDTEIDVYTGWQMGTDEPVLWEGPVRFNPDKQSKVSVRTTGKLLAMRFETKADTNWSISGIELEYEMAGNRGSRSHL